MHLYYTHTQGSLHNEPQYKDQCTLPHFRSLVSFSATSDVGPHMSSMKWLCHDQLAQISGNIFLLIWPVCSRQRGYHLFGTFSVCSLDTSSLFFFYFVSFSFLLSLLTVVDQTAIWSLFLLSILILFLFSRLSIVKTYSRFLQSTFHASNFPFSSEW